MTDKRRERYGHPSNLLKTEYKKGAYNYTRLPIGVYDRVLQRAYGKIKKKDA